MSYRVLVLPPQATMRPALLRKIHATSLRPGRRSWACRPRARRALENFPKSDEEVRKLAREVWGEVDTKQPGERAFGKGRVIWGKRLDAVLTALGSPTDFESSTKLRFTHRRSADADIYFVANPKAESVTTTAAFRINGKAPELWWPDSGRIERPAVYDEVAGVVRLPLTLGPQGSVFVVFREKAAPKSERIVSVTRAGVEIFGTTVKPLPDIAGGDSPGNFTFALWVKPDADTTLVREANSGVAGLSEPRNDVFAAPHGDAFGGAGHAGSGLAVGRNGVCVFEHGANYFAPHACSPRSAHALDAFGDHLSRWPAKFVSERRAGTDRFEEHAHCSFRSGAGRRPDVSRRAGRSREICPRVERGGDHRVDEIHAATRR
jgi:hypothetical protein